MIDSIFGKLIKKEPTFAVVDMNGIRIKISITIATFEKLSKVGASVELMTYLHVREDILDLYGFTDDIERDVFLKLIGVSGIGPRSGISILSGATQKEFKQRIIGVNFNYTIFSLTGGREIIFRYIPLQIANWYFICVYYYGII